MSNTNNNLGINPEVPPLKDDIQFDLGPTAGTDTLATKTGQIYDIPALIAIAVARGAAFHPEDGSADIPLTVKDQVIEVEVDLKLIRGEGFHEGLDTQYVVATTQDASYKNNGSWTNLDPQGGRQDGEDNITVLPTSVDEIFVENGSVLTVHLTFMRILPQV